MFDATVTAINIDIFSRITLSVPVPLPKLKKMARGSKSRKWYAVQKGRTPGIYTSWDDCKAQTQRFGGAIFKSFKTENEAQAFMKGSSGTSSGSLMSSVDPTKKRGMDSQLDEIGQTSSSLSTSKKVKLNCPDNYNSSEILTVIVYFDGGSRGNPGLSGAGCILKTSRGNQELETVKIRSFLGRATNNFAEYTGLLCGLNEALAMVLKANAYRRIDISVKGDSNLIINQMNDVYQCKHKDLRPLFLECKEAVQSIQSQCIDAKQQLSINFQHVYRNANKEADALANEAMDQKNSWTERSGSESSDSSSTNVAASDEVQVIPNRRIGVRYDYEDI